MHSNLWRRAGLVLIAVLGVAVGGASAQPTFELRPRWDAETPTRYRVDEEMVQEVSGEASTTLFWKRGLEYTERVIQESMRLYPPVWMIERVTLGPDVVAGKELPKDTIVAMCMYTAHRNPKYWPNPEGFDPDRFLPERSEDRPRYAYFPFGAGPRMCIGNHFAMMEAKLLVAMLIQRFDVELRPGHRVALDPGVTLRPKGGLPMRITPRRQGRRLERVA